MRFLRKRGGRAAADDAAAGPAAHEPTAPVRDVRADLASRGISGSFSGPVAARLATRVEGLTEAQYRALLEGVAAAYGVHREEGKVPAPAPVEMQRLIQDFAVELQKLDEGLRLLSTYLLRIRDRTTGGGEPPRLMH